MINYQYKIKNIDGIEFTINDHITDPENFIALQSYPQFDVDIKNNERDRKGQHGIWDFFSYYGRRVVTFDGVIIGENESEVETLIKLLQKTMAFPLQPSDTFDGTFSLEWTDASGESWTIQKCKLYRPIRFNRSLKQLYKVDFSFSIKSESPFIVGQTLNSVAGTRGWETTGGVFPLELPALLGITQNNVMTINQTGATGAHTLIRLYGEVEGAITNPRVRNITTGQTFYLTTTIPLSTDWIEIDSESGTVVDDEGNDLSGLITGDSEFITLVAGANELLYESDEDPLITLYEPSAPFTVKYRETKI